MKTKKVKYTKKFILSMVMATSIAITGCGQSTPPQEEPQAIGIEVNENYAEEMAGKLACLRLDDLEEYYV